MGSEADSDDSIQLISVQLAAQKRLNSLFQIILDLKSNSQQRFFQSHDKLKQIQLLRFMYIFAIHSSDSLSKYITSRNKHVINWA